jgi:transitional endoplasmic reticulum ATPase
MEDIRKPVLYNNFEISDGVRVERRIAFEFFTEVYRLSNGKYLYLFLKIMKSDVLNNAASCITIRVGQDEYLGAIVDYYTKASLSDFIDSLSELHGFSAVAGMEDLKMNLKKNVIAPIREPEKYKQFKVPLPNGILLFGPPGCGKTFIVKKLAEEIGYNFFEIKHSDISSSYVHGTVGKIGRLFDLARTKAPSIVFIDEIDGIVPRRDNLSQSEGYKQEEINELLMQFNDAGKQNILIIAASNRPQEIDPALLRPGRIDIHIYVSPPDTKAREDLFRMYLSGRPANNMDYAKLSRITAGYASVDIEYICNEAAREALVCGHEYISQDTVEKIIKQTSPSITEDDMIHYSRFANMQRGVQNGDVRQD